MSMSRKKLKAKGVRLIFNNISKNINQLDDGTIFGQEWPDIKHY